MKPKSVIANLQICRGIAALLVVIGHSLHDLDAIAARAGLDGVHSSINWGAGIDIFFVISGFIMVHVAAADFGTSGGAQRFLLRRLARIAPMYWLVTTALIVGAFVAPGLLNVPIGGAWHIFTSYFFIPDWRSDMSVVRPVMALGWTLNYEMLFYAAFAAAMFLPFTRAIVVLTIVFIGATVAKSALDIRQTQLAFWMDPIILEFLFGVYIAIAYRAGWRLSAPAALALGSFGFIAATTALPEALGLALPINFLRYGAPAAMLVGSAALGPGLPDGLLTRFGIGLGNASYALYLCHPFVIRLLREVWLRAGGAALPLIAYCVVSVFGAVMVALALHRFVERPLAKVLEGWIKGRSPRQSAAPNESERESIAFRQDQRALETIP